MTVRRSRSKPSTSGACARNMPFNGCGGAGVEGAMAGMNPIMEPSMWGGESVPWSRCAARCGDGRMDNWEMEK